MCQVNMFQAKTDFSRLIALLEKREEDEIIIARNGEPVAKIVLWSAEEGKKRIGSAKGLFSLPNDFMDLDAEVAGLFGGENP